MLISDDINPSLACKTYLSYKRRTNAYAIQEKWFLITYIKCIRIHALPFTCMGFPVKYTTIYLS